VRDLPLCAADAAGIFAHALLAGFSAGRSNGAEISANSVAQDAAPSRLGAEF